jgi:hypothetical protein
MTLRPTGFVNRGRRPCRHSFAAVKAALGAALRIL